MTKIMDSLNFLLALQIKFDKDKFQKDESRDECLLKNRFFFLLLINIH